MAKTAKRTKQTARPGLDRIIIRTGPKGWYFVVLSLVGKRISEAMPTVSRRDGKENPVKFRELLSVLEGKMESGNFELVTEFPLSILSRTDTKRLKKIMKG